MEDAYFIDLTIDPPEYLESLKPDLIVYSLFPSFTIARETHAVMSKICRDVPKIVLGVPPGYMEDYARLEPHPFCVDYSEPEAVFSSLDDDLVEWRERAKGIAWMEDEDFDKSAPLRTCIHELKGTNWNLVSPSYWLFYDRVVYQVSRGCPWRCKFCVWGGSTVTDRTFRTRSSEQVATDIINLRMVTKRYRPQPIPLQLLSPQLTTNFDWIYEYFCLMEDPYPFQGNINLRELTRENLMLLKYAGMGQFFAGLEALTDPLLQRMNKPHDFEDVVRSIKILNEADVNYSLKLISGGYGETKTEIRECLGNIRAMKKRGIDHSSIVMGGPIVYYKGTVLGENPPEELAYDMRHKGLRQKHIHADEWIEVRAELKQYNLLDENSDYPVQRLKRPI